MLRSARGAYVYITEPHTMNFKNLIARFRKLPLTYTVLSAAGVAIIVLVGVHVATQHRGSNALPKLPAVAPASALASHVEPGSLPSSVPLSASSTASLPALPPAPAVKPAGVKAGYVSAVEQGKDNFGAWLALDDHVIKTNALAVTIPVVPASDRGARQIEWTAWLHIRRPVQTLTLREVGGAGVTLRIAGQSVNLSPSIIAPPTRSAQVVAGLAPGWYQVKLVGQEFNPGDVPITPSPSEVEVQLGSTNLNPEIPEPYWTPGAHPIAPASASSTTAPAPASTTAGH